MNSQKPIFILWPPKKSDIKPLMIDQKISQLRTHIMQLEVTMMNIQRELSNKYWELDLLRKRQKKKTRGKSKRKQIRTNTK